MASAEVVAETGAVSDGPVVQAPPADTEWWTKPDLLSDTGEMERKNQLRSDFEQGIRQVCPALDIAVEEQRFDFSSRAAWGSSYLAVIGPDLISNGGAVETIRSFISNALDRGTKASTIAGVFGGHMPAEKVELCQAVFSDKQLQERFLARVLAEEPIREYLNLVNGDSNDPFFQGGHDRRERLLPLLQFADFASTSSDPKYSEALEYMAHRALLSHSGQLAEYLAELPGLKEQVNNNISPLRTRLYQTASRLFGHVAVGRAYSRIPSAEKIVSQSADSLLGDTWFSRSAIIDSCVEFIDTKFPLPMPSEEDTADIVRHSLRQFIALLDNVPLAALREGVLNHQWDEKFAAYGEQLKDYFSQHIAQSKIPYSGATGVRLFTDLVAKHFNQCGKILERAGASVDKLEFPKIRESMPVKVWARQSWKAFKEKVKYSFIEGNYLTHMKDYFADAGVKPEKVLYAVEKYDQLLTAARDGKQPEHLRWIAFCIEKWGRDTGSILKKFQTGANENSFDPQRVDQALRGWERVKSEAKDILGAAGKKTYM